MNQETQQLTRGTQSPSDPSDAVWYPVGADVDFGDDRARAVDVVGQRLVLFRDSQGTLRCLSARCPHMGADLGDAEIEGDEIICPIHFWRWDGTGRCTLASFAPRAPHRLTAATWPVRVVDGTVYVGINQGSA